ncbi:phage tail protein [Flavobacterium macacae]|uniref:Phage tail protein n=1 Tax=Flavobacterium macacae TaxID=2488993 RepID=A0A3P3W863_9FLAO|nr:phage tail protein [Flavobacterium macacae]
MEEYIGILKLFAGNFAPQGWAFCNGQLLSISQNTALFTILGTTYGGNGTANFALPDFRSRIPIGAGQGPGLSNYIQGQISGAEQVTMTLNNMPSHNHAITGSVKIPTNDSNADAESPDGAYLGTPEKSIYSNSTNGFAAAAVTGGLGTAAAGGSQPFPIIQLVLAMNYIICLQGMYPPRP